jgi:hypothetical protein
MSATPEHVLSPALFDLIDEYVEQLKSGTALSGKVVPETSPVITFTQNAFAQFFENEVGSEITGFDFKQKQRAARLRYSKKNRLSTQALALISLFEQFCDVYEDVLGAGYGGQASVLEEFHCKLVVRLLERLRALAGAKHDSELRARVSSALVNFEEAASDYDWSSV